MATLSVLDLFTVGVGPSSSHTVGPMRAAKEFADSLTADELARLATLHVELLGSLGSTGAGHGTDRAVLAGLAGSEPETVDPDHVVDHAAEVAATKRLTLASGTAIDFDPAADLVLDGARVLPWHPNGMIFQALDAAGGVIRVETYFSVGGGFIVHDGDAPPPDADIPYPFASGEELVALCRATGLSIAELVTANELAAHPERDLRAGVLAIWHAMQDCVDRGCSREEYLLPGALKVRRRAPQLLKDLRAADQAHGAAESEWVTLFALAVNEENATGGRVVTAPTNGAAGIVPAVLHAYHRFTADASDDGIVEFLITAAAIGMLLKRNASISGAEVGCQGEVGSACAMAAAGLTAVWGGTPAQIENAAEIGIEHHLGLTCDPIGGLVQIPCIERNAIAANTAINAARIALRGDGTHHVSFDAAVRTMRETGADMLTKYKETSLGGLAVNVVEC
jgi:L-serine dehydratase